MMYGGTHDLTVEFDARGRKAWILLWPKTYRLVSVEERITMPDDVIGVVHDKSTWIRRGVTVGNSLVQPGWRGHLTLEVFNHSWCFRLVRRGEVLAQLMYHETAGHVTSYAGRYQDQPRGPVRARLQDN